MAAQATELAPAPDCLFVIFTDAASRHCGAFSIQFFWRKDNITPKHVRISGWFNLNVINAIQGSTPRWIASRAMCATSNSPEQMSWKWTATQLRDFAHLHIIRCQMWFPRFGFLGNPASLCLRADDRDSPAAITAWSNRYILSGVAFCCSNQPFVMQMLWKMFSLITSS